jgi:hypothetical protein
LPEGKEEYLDTLTDIAEDLLEAYRPADHANWHITSVAVQPAPKSLMHTRDLRIDN